MKGRKGYGELVLAAIAIYIGISTLVFALRHPELTDTQRLMRTWDALRWQ